MTHESLIQNWPILSFLAVQVIGALKILANIKVVKLETSTNIELLRVEVTTELKYLNEKFEKQNGRVNHLEDKYETLNVSVAAHHGNQHNSKQH